MVKQENIIAAIWELQAYIVDYLHDQGRDAEAAKLFEEIRKLLS